MLMDTVGFTNVVSLGGWITDYNKITNYCKETNGCAANDLPALPWDGSCKLIIDVRKAEDYEAEHAPCSVNFPRPTIANHTDDILKLLWGDAGKAVGVHCYSGGWAEEARGVLIDAGFGNVENLGGWDTDNDAIMKRCTVVIDVRKVEDYAVEHAACAVNFPRPTLDDPDVQAAIKTMLGNNMKHPIAVHCYSGGWAEEARVVLADVVGFTNVVSLGGWNTDYDTITNYCKETNGCAADDLPITLPPQPSEEEQAQMTATEAEGTASDWRTTARNTLLQARDAAEAVASAANDEDRSRLEKAAATAAQLAAAAEVAREEFEANAAKKEAENQLSLHEQECILTGDKAIDCLVSEWATTFDDCSAECDSGGAVVQTRGVTVKPMCGGKACGPLTSTTQCPETPTCLFETPQAVRTTVVLSGIASDVFDKTKDAVKLVLKAHVRKNVLGVGGPKFKLDFVAHDTVATPTEGYARRGRRAAVSELRSESDTELDVDIITDAAEVELEVVEEKAKSDSATEALLKALQDEVQAVNEHIKDVFFEPKSCAFDSSVCAGTACGWNADSCDNARWCGSCGMKPDCFRAIQACLNGGDCSHVAGVMDEARTIDTCLLDPSQLP